MSYIGSNPQTQSFIAGTDYFNGDGSTTAFTLSRSVVSTNDIQATVNNVVQQPNTAYTVSGTTITFTSAPSAGSSNIYVRYMSTTTQSITPSQNTVSYSTLNSDNQSKLGISFKNRIINGAMVIDQRNNGSSITPTNGQYSLDRYQQLLSQTGKYTVQQNAGSVTPPAGFSNYLGITSTSAYSLGASDYFQLNQTIEGYNIADLNWGTANAKTVTLSFWVRSSLTGTFAGLLLSSTASYSYPFTYTISSANTWTYITQTIVGPQVATWDSTNGSALGVRWALGLGSSLTGGTNNNWNSGTAWSSVGTSVVGTSGATFYLTGVQFEVGTQATTFDYRSYGTEFALCERYYIRLFGNDKNLPVGLLNQGTYSTAVVLPTAMRATPSLDQIAASLWRFNGSAAGETLTNTWTLSGSSGNLTVYLNASAVPSGSNGYAVVCRAYDTNNYLGFSAEL